MPFVQSTVSCDISRGGLAVVSTRRSAIRRLFLEPPQHTRELFASSAAARPPSGKAAAEPS
jgi:hypothetical protein